MQCIELLQIPNQSNIEHRTSNIVRRTSHVEHRTSNIENRTSNQTDDQTSIASNIGCIEHRLHRTLIKLSPTVRTRPYEPDHERPARPTNKPTNQIKSSERQGTYPRRQLFKRTAREQSIIRTVSPSRIQKDTEELEATQEQLVLIPIPQLLQHHPCNHSSYMSTSM